MNNGKYHTEQFQQLQREVKNRRWGPILVHKMVCEKCGCLFNWHGRRNTKAYQKVRFCSRKCANSTGGRAKADKYGITQYVTIAKKYHKEECAVCGVTDVLDVHHIDGNRSNNHWTNLQFLCPNDHARVHRACSDRR